MFCSFLILIVLIFTNRSIHSSVTSLQLKPVQEERHRHFYDCQNSFKDFQKRKVDKEVLDHNDYEQIRYDKEIPKIKKRSYVREDLNEEYNRNQDNIKNKFSLLGEGIFNIGEHQEDDKMIDIENSNYPSYPSSGIETLKYDLNNNYLNYEDMDFIDKQYDVYAHNYKNKKSYGNRVGDCDNVKASYSNALIFRRDVPSVNNRNLENSSLYPSVLTKALQISLNPTAPTNTAGGLLANVAEKLNTSTLDLAQKLTKSETAQNNDQFAEMVQNYLTNTARSSSSSTALKQPLIQNSLKENPFENLQTHPEQNSKTKEGYLENEESSEGIVTTSSLKAILDHVLKKLDSLHDGKTNDNEEHPDGAPCDIVGSWSSNTLGLCLEIQLDKEKIRDISPAEINNKILAISVAECTPPKHHQLIDLDWKFTGSALKQWGGLFFLYGQKRSESVAATFLGFCRTCGGIDTIFGSWNFLSPSKDCNDISLAFDVKRDVLRRNRMEIKRRERFKDLLYQSRHGKN